jgi:hypothetical protein
MSIMSAGICISSLKGKSWLSAIEDVLSSFGMTMRYTDDASVTVMPLANLPLYGTTQRQDALDLWFHGGTKTLVPAYREILSECDYHAKETIEIDLSRGLEYGEIDTYEWRMITTEPNYFERTGAGYVTPIIGSRQVGWQADSRLMKPFPYGSDIIDNEGEDITDRPLLVANDKSGTTYAAYRMQVNSSAATIHMEFGKAVTYIQGYLLYAITGSLTASIIVALDNQEERAYWNGKFWSKTLTTLEYEGNKIDIEIKGVKLMPDSAITIYFDKLEYKGTQVTQANIGIYARLLSLAITSNNKLLEKDTVKTINDEKYNVRAERELSYGAISQQSLAAFSIETYPNALWDMTSAMGYDYFPYQCHIGADYTKTYPLPALVHRQLLMFHHDAQPMLSGNCTIPQGARFDRLYSYKGVDYILQGGTLDLFSGRMDITLRGFIAYNDLWD